MSIDRYPAVVQQHRMLVPEFNKAYITTAIRLRYDYDTTTTKN